MKKLILVIGSVAMLSACGSKVDPSDKSKPTIEILSSVPVFKIEGDEKVIETAKNASFSVNVKLTDNSNLKQLKYDIHTANDEHKHARMEGGWEISKIVDISGKEHSHTISIKVPSDAVLGEYHLGMAALDVNGNESAELIMSVEVK